MKLETITSLLQPP